MLRTWTYAWWKPVVGIVIAITGAFVAPLLLFPVLILGLWVEGNLSAETLQKVGSLQTVDPAGLLWLNLGLASMILVAWFVMRVVHRMRPRWLASVMPKMRWRFFFACLGLSAVALLAQVVVSTLLPGSQEGDVTGKLNSFTSTTAVLALIVLFTTPLQAAGEEYLFRGYLLQALGSLFRSKWVAILGTAAMFTLAHGLHQNPPLYFDRFMFGLIAGWLVTRTGGLEAGIAMHILNNFLAFGFALSFGNLTDTLNVSEVGWWNIPLTLTQSGVYALLVVLLARKMDLRTKTSPPVEPPAAQASYDAAPVPSGA
jgi:membrane protease YdiL (CAAX protease family)